MTTIAMSNMPDLTMAVSVPRLAAIEHPFGQTMVKPWDKDGQRAALMAVLEAVEEMKAPGRIRHLQLGWTGTAKEAQSHPQVPPPIIGYLKWHPWELPMLFSRDVPRES